MRTVTIAVIILTLIYSVIVLRISAPLMRIFVADKDVISIGVYMISVMILWYFLYIPIETLAAALRGLGDVIIPLVITVAGVCFIRVGWVIITEKLFHEMSIMLINYPVTWAVTSSLFIIYYHYRMRKMNLKTS